MKQVVRTFLFNPEGHILMARHKPGTPWVLPGGHVEDGESLHEAMIREIREEFGVSAQFFEVDRDEILHHRGKKLAHHALPIAIYDLEYMDTTGKDKSRTEYVFLMETDEDMKHIQTEEISEYAWTDVEEILAMKPNIDTYDFIIEMLEKIVGEDEELGE